MSTVECKDAIVEQWDRGGSQANWKRTSKRTADGMTVREFENKSSGETVIVMEEDEETFVVHPGGPVYYHLSEDEDEEMGGFLLCFNPKSYWDKEGCLYDQHMGWVMEHVYGVPADIVADELCENQFAVEGDRDEIVEQLEAAGLTTHQPFSDFLNRM